MQCSSTTHAPAMPLPKVRRESERPAPRATRRRPLARADLYPVDCGPQRLDRRMGRGCRGQVPRQPLDDVTLRRDGRVSGRQGRVRLDV